MNRSYLSKTRIRTLAAAAMVAAAICGLSPALWSADQKSDSTAAKSDSANPKAPAAKSEKKAPKKLSGAELYAIHCNRCHAERYPTERTDAQWKTIMMHMQTRAQLPGKDAKAILKYLQEEN